MAQSTDHLTTAEQLAELPADGRRYELVDGVLRMMSPAGGRHGRVAAKLLIRIANHVERHGLGVTFAAETGFVLRRSPDTVRAPDVAYVSRDHLGQYADHAGYLPLVPDLVGEVVSPGDRRSDVEAKAAAWLEAGVRVVLVVDPQSGTTSVHRPGDQVQSHTTGAADLNDVLPGFQLDVGELLA